MKWASSLQSSFVPRVASRAGAAGVIAVVVAVLSAVHGALPAAAAPITSSGPLTMISTSSTLNCDVRHIADVDPEFFASTACGTFVSLTADGVTNRYSPASVPAGSSAVGTPYTFVSQVGPTGTGTSADPFTVVTTVNLGSSGVQLIQRDTYVQGEEAYRTDVRLINSSQTPYAGRVYRAGDCYLQNSDNGFGRVDGAAIACLGAQVDANGNLVLDANGAPIPGDRIEQWYPLTAGSSYYQSGYSSVWSLIGQNLPFDNTCLCASFIDNGAGLSWDIALPAAGETTVSSLITFSPLGRQPLVTTKTVATPNAAPGAQVTYTINIANPNPSPVRVESIFDVLPAGFTYVAGSTTGVTTANPAIAAGENRLTWTGNVNVPAGQSRTLSFKAEASSTPGTYFNQAGGTADGFTVAPTGPTAPVTIATALFVEGGSVTEGAPGTSTPLRFKVYLSDPVGQEVRATFETVNGSAQAGSDYVGRTGTVIIPAGTTDFFVDVSVTGDGVVESNETFELRLSNAQGAVIASPGTAVGTILNDDTGGERTISVVDPAPVNEGSDPGVRILRFRIVLSTPSTSRVPVQFHTTDGTAISGVDYNGLGIGTVTFLPGETEKIIEVVVNDDGVDEDDETVLLVIDSATGALILDDQGSGTIIDDDAPPLLTIADRAVTEGNRGTTTIARFPLALSAASGRPVTVTYTTSDGTAAAPGDYTAASSSVTIPAGARAGSIAVVVVGDNVDEPNERFAVDVTSAQAVAGDLHAVGTIRDDELPVVTIADRRIYEGTGDGRSLGFVVTLSTPATAPVQMAYTTNSVRATAPADFTATSGTLDFPVGVTRVTFAVPIVADALDELDERFTVTLSGLTGPAVMGDANANAIIVDDDAPPTIAVDDARAVEGDGGGSASTLTFPVRLSAPSGLTVKISYRTVAGTATAADFTATTGTLTFAPGETAKDVAVTVTGDVLHEANEQLRLVLESPLNGTVADGSGVGTIIDEEGPFFVSVNDVRSSEASTFTFTVSLSATPLAGEQVTVKLVTANGTATAGADYVALPLTTLTFTSSTGPSKTVTVTTNEDGDVEQEETFFVDLSRPSTNARVSDDRGVGTIVDNDFVS